MSRNWRKNRGSRGWFSFLKSDAEEDLMPDETLQFELRRRLMDILSGARYARRANRGVACSYTTPAKNPPPPSPEMYGLEVASPWTSYDGKHHVPGSPGMGYASDPNFAQGNGKHFVPGWPEPEIHAGHFNDVGRANVPQSPGLGMTILQPEEIRASIASPANLHALSSSRVGPLVSNSQEHDGTWQQNETSRGKRALGSKRGSVAIRGSDPDRLSALVEEGGAFDRVESIVAEGLKKNPPKSLAQIAVDGYEGGHDGEGSPVSSHARVAKDEEFFTLSGNVTQSRAQQQRDRHGSLESMGMLPASVREQVDHLGSRLSSVSDAGIKRLSAIPTDIKALSHKAYEGALKGAMGKRSKEELTEELWREEEAFLKLPSTYFDFLREEASFIGKLIQISQDLIDVKVESRLSVLKTALTQLNAEFPAPVYIPLCSATQVCDVLVVV